MPVPDHPEAVGRHLLRDEAYERLSAAIVDGTLRPGESLHDDELCAWLGLSRTPVREALGRLRDEGLVEMRPQRFTRVSPMSVVDVRELVPVLAVMHALATELAVPRLTGEDHGKLRSLNAAFVTALRASDAVAAYEADDAFHDVFVAGSGNLEIARVLEHAMPRVTRMELLADGGLPGRRSVAQHEAMIGRAAMGDAPGAAAAARANWMTLGSVLESAFTR